MTSQANHHLPVRLDKLRRGFGASDEFIAEILGVSAHEIPGFMSGTAQMSTLPLARLARLEDFRARLHPEIATQVAARSGETIGPDGQTLAQMLRAGKVSPLDAAAIAESAFLAGAQKTE